MAIVKIRISGREYAIACDDGQEDHLRMLADEVDERVRALVFGMGANPGEAMSLLLTALTLADEVAENKREIKKIGADVERMQSMLGDGNQQQQAQENRMLEIEAAMATTLDEIALRIEKIADQIELG